MKYLFLTLTFVLLSRIGVAQSFGIGTDIPDPNAILEVQSTTKGVLIPRLTTAQRNANLGSLTITQRGLLIYNLDDAGFNYWDGSAWVSFPAISGDADWHEEGTTNAPNDINDDIFHLGNVAIGKNTTDYALDVYSNSSNRGINNLLNGGSITGQMHGIYNHTFSQGIGHLYGLTNVMPSSNRGNKYGVYNDITNNDYFGQDYSAVGVTNAIDGSSDGDVKGTHNIITQQGNGDFIGTDNNIHNLYSGEKIGTRNRIVQSGALIGYGNHYGTLNEVFGPGPGEKYGSKNIVDISAGGNHYGVYSEALKAGSNTWAGYFLGDVYIGTTTVNGYNLPAIDGTANQIMQTDGSGNLSWVDNTDVGAERINELIDGKSDNDGTNDGSSVFLGVGSGANDDESDNQNVGVGFQALNSNTTGSLNTAQGHGSLQNSTTGFANSANGAFALSSNTIGDANTANGVSALALNTLGSSNTACGVYSLRDNTIGDANTAYGSSSLQTNISGASNTAIGVSALFSNITGSSNVALGNQAGYNELGSNKLYIENSNADANNALVYGEFDNDILRTNGTLQVGNPAITGYAFPTADGTASQIMQTDGSGNVGWVNTSSFGVERINDLIDGKSDNDGTQNGSSIFLGIGAGTSDDGTDNRNVAIGRNILVNNVSGNNNTVIGYQALLFGIRNGNTAVGYQAGYNNQGNANVFLGKEAGYNNQGDSNVFLGNQSGLNETGSNRLYIDNTDAVRSSALIYGEFGTDNTVTGNILRINGELQLGTTAANRYFMPTARGTANQVMQTDGSGQLSWVTISDVTTASNGLTLNTNDVILGGSLNQATTITHGINNFTHNLNSTGDFRIQDNGTNIFNVDASTQRVGILEAAPSFNLHLKQSSVTAGGTGGFGLESSTTTNNWKIYHSGINLSFAENGVRRAYITGATGVYVTTSDKRLKKDITEVESILDGVNKLRAYRYLYLDQDATAEKTIGFIAQDVQQLFPELVETGEDGYYGLNYAGFSVIAVKAIQEQQEEIDELKSENVALIENQKSLEERLQKIEEYLKEE